MRAQTETLIMKKKRAFMPHPGPLIFTALAARHTPGVYMEEHSSLQFSSDRDGERTHLQWKGQFFSRAKFFGLAVPQLLQLRQFGLDRYDVGDRGNGIVLRALKAGVVPRVAAVGGRQGAAADEHAPRTPREPAALPANHEEVQRFVTRQAPVRAVRRYSPSTCATRPRGRACGAGGGKSVGTKRLGEM